MLFGLFSSRTEAPPPPSERASSIRLTVTAVRLMEFDIPELAAATGLPLETVQAFVDRRLASGAVEIAPAPHVPAMGDLMAVPVRYRIYDTERAKVEVLEERIAEAISHLTEGDPDPHAATFMLLENTIGVLEGPRRLMPSSRRARIREACTYFDIAAREVEELRSHVDPATAAALDERLGRSERRLRGISTEFRHYGSPLATRPGLRPDGPADRIPHPQGETA